MARDEGSGGAIAAFLLGALAGAALAILYAPAPGDEMRRKLAERAREGRDAFERARRAAAGSTGGGAGTGETL